MDYSSSDPDLYPVITPPVPTPRQYSHSISSSCTSPLPDPTEKGPGVSGGPNPDPGMQTAGDAASRQMAESQLMIRPVPDASEADYGYSDLDYYPPAGGFSSPQLDPQALLDSDSTGYQDTAAYEMIGPSSTSCGRNNADDAQKAATSAENEFAANLPPPTADTGSRKDEIPSEIYANSQWTEFWQEPDGGGGEGGIKGGGEGESGIEGGGEGESGIEGGGGCKARDTVQYSSSHSPPVPVTGGGRCSGGGGGGGVGEKSKHEASHYSNPHSPPVPVSGGGAEGGGQRNKRRRRGNLALQPASLPTCSSDQRRQAHRRRDWRRTRRRKRRKWTGSSTLQHPSDYTSFC